LFVVQAEECRRNKTTTVMWGVVGLPTYCYYELRKLPSFFKGNEHQQKSLRPDQTLSIALQYLRGRDPNATGHAAAPAAQGKPTLVFLNKRDFFLHKILMQK
jgi:hypothetical protein